VRCILNSIAWNVLFITAYNSPYCLNSPYVSASGSDQYIGDLFDQTNAAILDEIKKEYRLLHATAAVTTGVESVGEEFNETPKAASSSALDNSTGQRFLPHVRQNAEHFHIPIQSTSTVKIRRSSSPSAEDERPYKRQNC
jgi:hypothetical protein